jgi:ATP-dependent helicase HepA
MAPTFCPGQRWISDGEPELGLGTVARVGPRTVTLAWTACAETREYGLDQAPLRRARFRAGDTVRGRDGAALVVRSVSERDGLLVYHGPDRALAEADLDGRLGFGDPMQRLLAGHGQPPEAFALRLAALGHQHRARKSGVRGFLGGRIELIPHQLYVAAEVTARLLPRVLLADEVGLGKTIEACLILHRLLLTGRARRVLVLLPDSLVLQWFLELYRRFNLWFHIFDEERCAALELEAPGANPFLEDQLVLCALSLLAGNPERARQAEAAGWDLLVVDEAHHLAWTPAAASPAYQLVERLAAAAPGLLLLTATPEQLGVASHFGRLRLLDPDRFHDLDAFLGEAERFQPVAALAERLLAGRALAPAEAAALGSLLRLDPAAVLARQGEAGAREAWLGALLDRHGTGRVLFRNTRSAVAGFPRRRARLAVLEAGAEVRRALAREFAADADPAAAPAFRPDFAQDPRLDWLAELLRIPGGDKVLLICRTRAKAEAIERALRPRVKAKTALFHEELTLVQRDRNAAWFGEPQGARLLICSEIGSEGRNFQFAHQLVLFDLPLDPDLLEQRIGRLDRIGQARDIQVHVPYVPGTPQEALARWYHEGLDAFQEPLHGGLELMEQFRERLLAGPGPEPAAADRWISDARAARDALRARLARGRDRLLELHSFRPEACAALVREIAAQDQDPALDRFMLSVFEHFFVEVEELAPRTYQLGSMGALGSTFPGLPAEGLTVTFDRQRALARESLQFLTWDHPLVGGALDLLLGGTAGTACFSRWPDPGCPGLYLEAVFLLECVAPPELHLDRFLPPTPLRVLVDHQGHDRTRALPRALVARQARPGDSQGLLARPGVGQELLPRMLRQAEAVAEGRRSGLVARARAELAGRLDPELERLQALRQVNPSVDAEELRLLREQKRAMDQHLLEARLRLDSLHLVHRG